MKSPPLVVLGIGKRLGARRVLDDVSFVVEDGEACALIGENGAGKSTLLRVVAGVLAADRGDVRVVGASLRDERVLALSRLGYAPEGSDIPEHLRATEWLALVASLRRAAPLDRETFGRLGLGPFEHQRVGTLSLGQRRRLSLAAALLGHPTVLVLDEPSNGLDGDSLAALTETVARHTSCGGVAIFATHDAAWAARAGARVLRLAHGRIAQPSAEEPPDHADAP
jgi:ABC-type multidrug transport system ATPase subunit